VAPDGREPERQRQGHGGEQGESVPVPDRIAQACDAGAVREKARKHLAEQRPPEHAEEQHGENGGSGGRRTTDERSDVDTEHGERGIDETAIEIRPRSVRRDRPHDREAAPSDESPK